MSQEDRRGFSSLFAGLKNLFRGSAPDQPSPTPGAIPAREIAITDANRADLLRLAETAPLAYGYWGELKHLYKEAERTQDPALLGALTARLDAVPFPEASNRLNMLPTPLSTEPTDQLNQIRVAGSYAYLLSGGWNVRFGFKVADISDPVQPRPVQKVDIQQPTHFVLNGTQAIIVVGQQYGRKGGIHLLDLSQPEYPQVTAKMEFRDPIRAAVLDRYTLVLTHSHRSGGLFVLDLADPSHPITVGETRVANPFGLLVRGETAYVVSGPQNYNGLSSLLAFDLSNPRQPRQAMSIQIGRATAFDIAGQYAYVIVGNDYYTQPRDQGLSIYDLAQNGKPIGFLPMERAKSLAVQGRYVFVGVEGKQYGDFVGGGLRIVDVTDPVRPHLVGTLPGGVVEEVTAAGAQALFSMATQYGEMPSLRIADLSDPTRPILLGASPSRRTLAYMKRRARRVLHTLALQDPAQYIALATETLLKTGKDRTEIDGKHQWVSMDILFGESSRYQQAGHGRGAYIKQERLSIRRREERYPELWDRYPTQIATLYSTPNLPWQTQEAALKMLRARKTPLPVLSDAGLARFLNSSSSLLIVTATRAIAARLRENQAVAPDLAADAFFLGSGRTRKGVREFIAAQTQQGTLGSKWTNPFANRLYKLASYDSQGERLSRRQNHSFLYLIRTFPAVLSRQAHPELAVRLYATRRPELVSWALEAMRQVSVQKVREWLQALEPLPEDMRNAALERITESIRTQAFDLRQLRYLLLNPSDWVRAAAWDLVATGTTPDDVLVELWNLLLEPTEETAELRSALTSASAIALFNRLPFDGERWANLLDTRPFLVGLLPISALEAVARVLPAATTVRLVAGASDAQWPALRSALVRALTASDLLNAFWQIAWQQIDDTGDPVLTARLLDDPEMAQTFLEIDATGHLDAANPVFGPLLGRWVRAHEAHFAKDSPELLKIATHMLPAIRDFGLERVRALGMGLPFALRLLESEMPPSVTLGKMFFEAETDDAGRAFDYALALCDSPKASVRAYGRSYLESRRELLPTEMLLARLSEHPDPETQAYVAARLLQPEGRSTDRQTVALFDRQVMRTRDYSRKAKELVKRRYRTETTHDVPMLLEMARSRTPRDAEWALGQLARLALEGVEIEGITLEGTAGG